MLSRLTARSSRAMPPTNQELAQFHVPALRLQPTGRPRRRSLKAGLSACFITAQW
jgi:hypothetical protein